MCDTSRGGCGAVRVSAASLETRVAGRLLALMAAPPTWERLAELGATGGREPVTARALVQWWDSAVHSDQQALIGLLLDHVRVTPVPGEELGLLDADRLAFVWA